MDVRGVKMNTPKEVRGIHRHIRCVRSTRRPLFGHGPRLLKKITAVAADTKPNRGWRRHAIEEKDNEEGRGSSSTAKLEEKEVVDNDEKGDEGNITEESDLWSFVGSSETNNSFDEETAKIASMDEDDIDLDLLMKQLPDELREEFEKAKDDREELELVRLTLESKAQDLAETAVEAGEANAALQQSIVEIKEKIAEAEDQEAAAKAALEREVEELSKVKGDNEVDRDWLEERVDAMEEDSIAAEDMTESKSIEWEVLELQVRSARDKLEECTELRSKLESESQVLEAKAETVENEAIETDNLAADAMAEVELAVAAEMSAEARVEDYEKKIEEALKEIKKGIVGASKGQVEAAPVVEPSVESEIIEEEVTVKSDPDVPTSTPVSSVTSEQSQPSVTPEVPKVDAQAEVPVSMEVKKSSTYLPAKYFSLDNKVTARSMISSLFSRSRYLVAIVLVMLSASWAALRFGGKLKMPILNAHHVVSYTTDKIESIRAPISMVTENLFGSQEEPELDSGESGLTDTLWLLATCVVVVPLIAKLPGGSPVLGFLLGGALIGPNALGIINNLEAVRHIAELGVIFLLFNIGLELSFERLQAMQKYVFGLGTCQVVFTMAGISFLAAKCLGLNSAGAIIIGAAMSLSSTAVALQVLQDRGEASSRHGRASFSVLLCQDLAVVIFLMLVPLLATAGGGALSVKQFCVSIAQAVVKAVFAIAMIIAGGRLMFRPIYKRIARFSNAEIFAATTLLVVLGTSMLTQKFGLSMELGAFIAGLLLAETEYALQIESDIAPYRGLLLGLFFMTVGMEFSLPILIAQWKFIIAGIFVLLAGKTFVVGAFGPVFGLSRMASIRAGLMLAPGGEFAFVLLGEAVAKNILQASLCSQMYLVVAIGMALTPFLAQIGQQMGTAFDQRDVLQLQPTEGEVDDLRGHVIVAGFGRVGQMVCQLLDERLIPFVALDVQSDRVAKGRDMEMPVYFGDSGSAAVLHSVGASKASCAVVVLDTPGSNYRCVWAIKKHYPKVKIYVRARDVQHGINLEKAGASAVVPETLEPSLQLAAAVLKEMQLPPEEVATAIDSYRRKHISELSELAVISGSSLGYGETAVKVQAEA